MDQKKKENEQYYLERLLKSLSNATEISSTISIEPQERPDFLLIHDSTVIGVEVTQLFHGPLDPGSRQWEGDCLRVLEAAKLAWDSTSLPPLQVSVTFNKDSFFRLKPGMNGVNGWRGLLSRCPRLHRVVMESQVRGQITSSFP